MYRFKCRDGHNQVHANISVQPKTALPFGVPWDVQADGRVIGFAEAISEHRHKSSKVGRASTHEHVSCRQLLEIRHQVN